MKIKAVPEIGMQMINHILSVNQGWVKGGTDEFEAVNKEKCSRADISSPCQHQAPVCLLRKMIYVSCLVIFLSRRESTGPLSAVSIPGIGETAEEDTHTRGRERRAGEKTERQKQRERERDDDDDDDDGERDRQTHRQTDKDKGHREMGGGGGGEKGKEGGCE